MFALLQKQKTATTTARFRISGMHCTSCSLTIDGDLEDLPGVSSASTSYAKSVTTVKYDGKQVTSQKIVTTIQNLGYEVEEIMSAGNQSSLSGRRLPAN